MNLSEVDYQFDTCQISQQTVLENYRTMAKILRFDLEYIHPPCADLSAIEKQTLESLFQHSVASLHSDEVTSEEQQKANRIAKNVELDFNDDDDDDDRFWPSYKPPQDIPLYVNINVALSKKWIVNISSYLLDVY